MQTAGIRCRPRRCVLQAVAGLELRRIGVPDDTMTGRYVTLAEAADYLWVQRLSTSGPLAFQHSRDHWQGQWSRHEHGGLQREPHVRSEGRRLRLAAVRNASAAALGLLICTVVGRALPRAATVAGHGNWLLCSPKLGWVRGHNV